MKERRIHMWGATGVALLLAFSCKSPTAADSTIDTDPIVAARVEPNVQATTECLRLPLTTMLVTRSGKEYPADSTRFASADTLKATIEQGHILYAKRATADLKVTFSAYRGKVTIAGEVHYMIVSIGQPCS